MTMPLQGQLLPGMNQQPFDQIVVPLGQRFVPAPGTLNPHQPPASDQRHQVKAGTGSRDRGVEQTALMFSSRAILEGIWPKHDHSIRLTALSQMDGER